MAEAGDRAVDEARVALAQRRVVEAEPVERAGAEVLEQHVGARRELARELWPRACLRSTATDSLLRLIDMK